MKIDNNKEEGTQIWKTSEKEQNRIAKQNGRPIQQNRTKQKTESQNSKMKW
jgi:hypothetical protein